MEEPHQHPGPKSKKALLQIGNVMKNNKKEYKVNGSGLDYSAVSPSGGFKTP